MFIEISKIWRGLGRHEDFGYFDPNSQKRAGVPGDYNVYNLNYQVAVDGCCHSPHCGAALAAEFTVPEVAKLSVCASGVDAECQGWCPNPKGWCPFCRKRGRGQPEKGSGSNKKGLGSNKKGLGSNKKGWVK